MKQKILIVEDDRVLCSGIALSLGGGPWETVQAHSLAQARECLSPPPDLVLLDVNLPDGSGLDFCRTLKGMCGVPVVFLTANDMETDIVAGLELGADDYITKPFSLAVLRARVGAVLRRGVRPSVRVIGSLELDFDALQFKRGGQLLDLSKTEQRLLRILSDNPGVVLPRARLMDYIWPDGAAFVEENALSVTVKRLRAKLEDDPKHPQYIRTVFGVGYQWGTTP